MGKTLPAWDLAKIYPNLKSYQADFNQIVPAAERFVAFRGRLGESAETLKAAIEAHDDYERLCEKVYVYAHMKSDENTADNAARARQEKVEALFAELAGVSAYFAPELMAIPEQKMAKFLKSKTLAFYRRSLEEMLREKPHILSEKEERVIGLYSDILGNSSKTFSILNDADLQFGFVKDENGEKVPLTHGSYRKFLESSDRKVRREAFDKMYAEYKKYANTISTTLDGNVKLHAVSAKLRNFPSSLDASLFGDNVPVHVYKNLIKTINRDIKYLHDYLELRRSTMKLKKLDMCDLYAPTDQDCKMQFSWEEAVNLVKKSLSVMGEEYMEAVEKAFSQRWADVPERKGKRSGAYSSGMYDTYPYMLLNFNGTLNDVFTLAHELGHSIHSYYANKYQHYHYADYSIMLAEVASTTNELLLADYMLKNNSDRKIRIRLLNNLLDEIRATLFRQTMFAEFELWMHEQSESQTPLTADLLSEEYFRLNKHYHGPAVEANDAIRFEWARIPHFYYNFYVYKYATGISAAIAFSQRILSGNWEYVRQYIEFLKAGDSKDSLDILRDAGVDLSTPAPIKEALKHFGRLTKQLADLY